MDAIPLKPERKAQLEEFARRCGKDPADALDDALSAFFDADIGISRKPWKVSSSGMRTYVPGGTGPPRNSSMPCA